MTYERLLHVSEATGIVRSWFQTQITGAVCAGKSRSHERKKSSDEAEVYVRLARENHGPFENSQ
jgi:hypothetical protein